MNTRDKTKTILAQSLGIEVTDIDEASLLREDLELDASEISEIVSAISEQTGLDLPQDEIEELNSVGELFDWIDGHSGDAGI